MPTLSREQLNNILKLMLENQASDPESMLVVDSDKKEILDGRKMLSQTTEGLTGKRNDVDFGGRKARKEAENREFITKGFGKDVLDQDGKPILDEKGFPKKSHGYYKQRGNVFRINALDGTTIGSEITVNPHEKLLRANVFYEMLMKRQSKDLESKIAQDHPKEITATKSQLIANMVEDTRKAAAKKMGLNEAEMKGMQMVFDMDTKNIIVMNPYNAADARCFDVSSTLDTIDMSVTRMFESAKEEELGALSKSIEVVEEENDAITKLDSDINSAMNDYEEQLKAYKKQSASSFESIKKAMLRDNVAPKTVDERMKALKGNMEKLDKIANLERYVAQTKAIQMKESLEAQEKATEVTRAALDKIENKDTALLYSAIKEGNTVFSQFAVNINQGFNDLLVNLKDQEVIDKAKADLAKAQKEYKSYLNRIGELEDKRLAKVKELKEKQSKQMDNLVKDAEEKQDAAYKERIKELKGSYSFLPSWLGGKTGLEKEIISTMADQAKAMASATLESVEEGDSLAPAEIAVQEHATEIMQERIRLRGLRDSINEQLESASQATTPSVGPDASSVGFEPVASEGSERGLSHESGEYYSASGSQASKSAASERSVSATAGDTKAELIEKLKLAYQVHHREVVAMGLAAAENKETAKKNADSASKIYSEISNTTEVQEKLDTQVNFLEELLKHCKMATTKFVGKNKIEEYITKNQDFEDKRAAIEGMFVGDYKTKPPETVSRAGIARAVSQVVGAAPLPDGLNEAQITEMIETYSKERDAAKTLVERVNAEIIRTKQQQVNVTDKSYDVEGKITRMKLLMDYYGGMLEKLGVSDAEIEGMKNAAINIDEGDKQAILKEEGEFSEEAVMSSYEDLLRNDSASDHSSSQSSNLSGLGSVSSSSQGSEYLEQVEQVEQVDAGFPEGSPQQQQEEEVQQELELNTIMANLDSNAEQSLTARKKLTYLAELGVMSPVLATDGGFTKSKEYLEKLQELEGLYKEHPTNDVSIAYLFQEDIVPAQDSPQDLVRRYENCVQVMLDDLQGNDNLRIALTGSINTKFKSYDDLSANMQNLARQASAITEAQLAQATISRDTAQKQADVALDKLVAAMDEYGINLLPRDKETGKPTKLFEDLKKDVVRAGKTPEEADKIVDGIFKDVKGFYKKGERTTGMFWYNVMARIVNFIADKLKIMKNCLPLYKELTIKDAVAAIEHKETILEGIMFSNESKQISREGLKKLSEYARSVTSMFTGLEPFNPVYFNDAMRDLHSDSARSEEAIKEQIQGNELYTQDYASGMIARAFKSRRVARKNMPKFDEMIAGIDEQLNDLKADKAGAETRLPGVQQQIQSLLAAAQQEFPRNATQPEGNQSVYDAITQELSKLDTTVNTDEMEGNIKELQKKLKAVKSLLGATKQSVDQANQDAIITLEAIFDNENYKGNLTVAKQYLSGVAPTGLGEGITMAQMLEKFNSYSNQWMRRDSGLNKYFANNKGALDKARAMSQVVAEDKSLQAELAERKADKQFYSATEATVTDKKSLFKKGEEKVVDKQAGLKLSKACNTAAQKVVEAIKEAKSKGYEFDDITKSMDEALESMAVKRKDGSTFYSVSWKQEETFNKAVTDAVAEIQSKFKISIVDDEKKIEGVE